MRMLSSRFLLGSLASVAMMSVAGAADLPMKAKAPAVQYVKICSLYGAGFYYIPGTDTCLKIGGFIRVDAHYGATAAPHESVDFTANYRSGNTRLFNTQTRAYATFDARSQTAYGTLRSYFLTGGNSDNGAAFSAYMNRAFIQLAGFTWGLTDSIFDTYSATPIHLNIVVATNGSIGASGIWQWRYTAQFGNGMSASVAFEEPSRRDKAINDGTFVRAAAPTCVVLPCPPAPLSPGLIRHGERYPDVTAQIGASGTWGRVQIAAAIHDASVGVSTAGTRLVAFPGQNRLGWAGMVGGLLNVPGMPGDTFGFQFTYAVGATGYVTGNVNTFGGADGNGMYRVIKGLIAAGGFVQDGALVGASVEAMKAWGFEAGYRHAWTPTLSTSIAGGYVDLRQPSIAAMNSRVWNVGSRTLWSPVQNFSLGVDVLYTHINGATGVALGGGGAPAGLTAGNVDVWTGMVRVTRSFWP